MVQRRRAGTVQEIRPWHLGAASRSRPPGGVPWRDSGHPKEKWRQRRLLERQERRRLHPAYGMAQAHRYELDSVFLIGINGQQCFASPIDEAHHRTALEFWLRRRVCPKLFWLIDCDVVPDDARTIMLSHRVGQHSVSVPVLLDSHIVNATKRDRRRCAQVRS
jgi:hypothetical protein